MTAAESTLPASAQPSAPRVLVTGAAGFVGPLVMAACRERFGLGLDIAGTARVGESAFRSGAFHVLDVTDAAATYDVIARYQPTHVVHLAGIAAPTRAGSDPALAWTVNLLGTLNVARALLENAPDATLVNAGSGLIYGDSASHGKALTEHDLVAPNSDYAATKAAADLALGALVSAGLKVVRCRPFNHTGPGQSEDFALPSFAAQIARIERGLQPAVLKVGNLEAERDFLDARDVADAYVACIAATPALPPGTIINIASGVGVSIRALLDQLLAMARVPITVEVDARRWRANTIGRFVGDATAARRVLAWQPHRVMADTLAALLDHERARAAV